MKSYVKYIGVVDKFNKVHSVEFSSGVNIITGKSSTGKSAMIEIFDYCFGSSEFTIPYGKITENANIYFVVLNINGSYIVIARKPTKNTYGFLKPTSSLPLLKTFNKEYFEDKFFIVLSDFKKELGKWYGLSILDTDTDLEDRKYRHQNRAKGRPSIRHTISFMLQHQNLVANKHSIFYRFDQKEKREQTIEQFKIFTGFVTQEYFTMKQSLAELEREKKQLEKMYQDNEDNKNKFVEKVDDLLNEYISIAGKKLLDDTVPELLLNPANTLRKIEQINISTDDNSTEYLIELNSLEKNKNELYAAKRDELFKLNDIGASISYANDYEEHLLNLDKHNQVAEHKESTCSFCNAHSDDITQEANKLNNAVNWLNKELEKSPYMLDALESEYKVKENKLFEITSLISDNEEKIQIIHKISKDLAKNKTLDQQALKVKLKIENIFESIIDNNSSKIVEELNKITKKITEIKKELKIKFDVSKKLKDAEEYINTAMKIIGNKFEFEETYQPIELKFSLDTFELWHEKEDGEKIYLRSMGSGANWLYSHLTLFLAIHKYLCTLGTSAVVPSILFLDQPSQVYFPTTIRDDSIKFDAELLKEKEGKLEKTDEDLNAVTNLFDQIVAFCENTLKETGIEPQIIITDHADHLKLSNNVDFESLVAGRRWRERGFIDLDPFDSLKS